MLVYGESGYQCVPTPLANTVGIVENISHSSTLQYGPKRPYGPNPLFFYSNNSSWWDGTAYSQHRVPSACRVFHARLLV